MDIFKILILSSNLEKEEQSWLHHSPWFQTILQNYSNQNSMILAWKKDRCTGQKRDLRNKPLCIWSINLCQRSQKYTMDKEWSLLCMVLGKLDSLMQKNEIIPLSSPYTTVKSKWIKDFKKDWKHKNPRRKHKDNLLDISFSKEWMFRFNTKGPSNRNKNKEVVLC